MNRRRLAAATALFLVLTGFLALTTRERQVGPESASAFVLAPSHRILPDGSRVELKDHARIVLDFTPSVRRVTLEAGEAHFSVERDPARPFVVSAATIEIRAIGTAFSVRKGPAAIEVLVTHGHVAVEQPTPAPPNAAVTQPTPVADLGAGRMAVVAITTPTTAAEMRAVSPAELVERLAWRIPRLDFTRTPLREAVALFNQHAPPDAPILTIADADVAALRVTGIFRADNLEGFVLLAEGTFGLEAERNDRTILLRRRR